MNVVYLVVQQGIYRHDIRGVYTSVEAAVVAAKRAAAEDRDNYHEYEVYQTVLDQYVDDVTAADGDPSFSKSGPIR